MKTNHLLSVTLFLMMCGCSGPAFQSAAKNCSGSDCSGDANAAIGKTSNPANQLPGDAPTSTNTSTSQATDNSNQNTSGTDTSVGTSSSQGTSTGTGTSPGGFSTSTSVTCTLDGKTVSGGQSQTFYSTKTSSNCEGVKQVRACNNGAFGGSGAFIYASCTEPPKKFDQANCSKNSGRWIQGACWFVGSQGQSCSSVCGGKSLVNLSATAYAGSQGNDDPNPSNPLAPGNYSIGATALCTQVLDVTLPQNRSSTNNCGTEGQGIGCAQLPNDSLGRVIVARCMAITTTADAIASNAKRACACQD